MGVTMKDLARKTNLSLGTISRYINGEKIKEKNKLLIDAAIEELHYQINEVARSLKTKRTKSIGIVLPVFNLHNMGIVDFVQMKLRTKNYGALIVCSNNDAADETNCLDFLLNKLVDGIILLPCAGSNHHLEKVKQRKIPLVIVDDYFKDDYCDFVISNNRKASAWGMEQFIEKGHREIVLLLGPENHFTAQQRLKGCLDSLAAHSIPVDKSLIIHTDYTFLDACQKLKKILTERKDITGVFATSYYLTQAVYSVVNDLGLKMPDDLSLVAYDNLDLTKFVTPKPYIIGQKIEKIASIACEKVLKKDQFENNGDSRIDVVDTENEIGYSIKML